MRSILDNSCLDDKLTDLRDTLTGRLDVTALDIQDRQAQRLHQNFDSLYLWFDVLSYSGDNIRNIEYEYKWVNVPCQEIGWGNPWYTAGQQGE